jgi:LPXTG-motif cell wall-anchored protein
MRLLRRRRIHSPAQQVLSIGITESATSTSDDTGTLYQYNTKSSPMKPASIGKWTGLTSDDQWVNGLGIGIGGTVVYAYGRGSEGGSGNTGNKYNAKILTYTPSTGIWDSTSGPSIDTTKTKQVAFIAGAVDLKTGNYLLGGYDASGAFQLYKYTPGSTTIDYVGSLGTSGRGAMNGDMASDAAGNLYVLGSQYPVAIPGTGGGGPGHGGGGPGHGGGGGQTQFGASMNIFKVNAGDLATAINSPGNGIPFTTPSTATIPASSGFNGLGFDGDGSAWVSNNNTMLNFDASNWQQKGQTQNITDANTDLATCLSPATLTVQKNVVGRADASDQFTLSVTNSGTAIQPATTTGSSTGIQADQIGPTPVVTNTTYTFAEAMASGSASAMSAYTTTWQCTAPSPYSVNVSGTGTSGSVTVPATIDPTSAAINCVFTNTPIPKTGALAITKAFDASVPSGATGPFSGKYTCTGTGLATATGSWTVNGQGAATLTADQGSASPTALPVGLSCSATETSPASGSSTGLPNSYVWGTPTISSAVTIAVGTTKTVTVTNKATHVTGSVSWSKTDESSHALAGSQWTITPTSPSGAAITVVDNGTHDADSAAGALKVTGLNVGTYSLKESKAPAGYVLSDKTYTFTISATSLVGVIKDPSNNNTVTSIVNVQQTPPTLPLTGGMSTDAFIIGGGGLIVLSVATALIMRRRKAVHV